MPTHTQTLPHEELDLWISGAGDRLNKVLDKVPGLSMYDGCLGTLDLGDCQAEVLFEPPQWIRVSSSAAPFIDPEDALWRNYWLPGNVRYAGNAKRMRLLADTQVDAVLHLASCFEEIRQGMSSVINGKKKKHVKPDYSDASSGDADEAVHQKLEIALKDLPFGENSIVHRKNSHGYGSWEIRPRIRGEAVPVLLDELSNGVRLHRTILDAREQSQRAVVADQALCLNEQIRFCRFTSAGDELVVETLLHAGLLETYWLKSAALAVASVSHWAKDMLTALAQHEHAASWYQILFFDRTPENQSG
jgi:hypothetical protein